MQWELDFGSKNCRKCARAFDELLLVLLSAHAVVTMCNRIHSIRVSLARAKIVQLSEIDFYFFLHFSISNSNSERCHWKCFIKHRACRIMRRWCKESRLHVEMCASMFRHRPMCSLLISQRAKSYAETLHAALADVACCPPLTWLFMSGSVRDAFVKHFSMSKQPSQWAASEFCKNFKAKICFHSLAWIAVCVLSCCWWRHELFFGETLRASFMQIQLTFSLAWLDVETSQWLWPFSLTPSACDNILWCDHRSCGWWRSELRCCDRM